MAGNIRSLYGLLIERALTRGLELELFIDDRLSHLLDGNALLLKQAVYSLADAAIAFTDWGKVSVAVIMEEEQGDGYQICFKIRDTGIGLPGNRPESIRGVDLENAKRQISQLGAQLIITGKPGSGLCLSFSLAIKKAEVTSEAEEKAKPSLALVNITHVKELAGNNPALELDLIHLFIRRVPASLQTMETALIINDLKTARQITDQLRSAFLLFGLTGLLEQQGQLDELLMHSSFNKEITDIFNSIKHQLSSVLNELEELVRTNYTP